MKRKYDEKQWLQDFWFRDIREFEYYRNLKKRYI